MGPRGPASPMLFVPRSSTSSVLQSRSAAHSVFAPAAVSCPGQCHAMRWGMPIALFGHGRYASTHQ